MISTSHSPVEVFVYITALQADSDVTFSLNMHFVNLESLIGTAPMGRPRRRWEDNIKLDLQEVGGGGGNWLELAQDRDRWRALVSTVMNFRVR